MSEEKTFKEMFWPALDNHEKARKAVMYGFWAAMFTMTVTLLLVIWSITSKSTVLGLINAWSLVDVAIFAAIAVGIYRNSRFAAVAGLIIFLIEKIYTFMVTGKGLIVGFFFLLCYVIAVRGTYALYQLNQGSEFGTQEAGTNPDQL